MSQYNGISKRIKNALKSILVDLKFDTEAGEEPAFAQVLDNNRMVFKDWPNVQILPGDITNERIATHQSDRRTNYIIRVRLPLEDTDDSQSATYDHMYDLTDLVLDTLDRADSVGKLNDEDPTIGTYGMSAERGDWATPPTDAGVVLLCDINVSILYGKDSL